MNRRKFKVVDKEERVKKETINVEEQETEKKKGRKAEGKENEKMNWNK